MHNVQKHGLYQEIVTFFKPLHYRLISIHEFGSKEQKSLYQD